MSEAKSGAGATVIPDVASLIRATHRAISPKNQKAGLSPPFLQKIISLIGCPGGAKLHPGLKVTSWPSSSTLPSSPFSPSSLS
jgi:hypothetical protein